MKQLVAICIIVILAGCFGAEPQKTGKEGKPLPEFSLLLTDSTTILHNQNIPKGKPFMLFFISPFCPHCKAQTEKIIDNIDNLKDIPIYCITSFPMSTLKDYAKRHELNKYPNIICGVDSAHILADYFEITGLPYMAIYDKNKKLNKAFLGEIYTSQLKKATEE